MAIDFEAGSSQSLTRAGSAVARNRSAETIAAWWKAESAVNAILAGYSTNNGGVVTSNTRTALEWRGVGGPNSLRWQQRAPDSGARVDGEAHVNEVLPNVWHLTAGMVDIAGDSLQLYHDEGGVQSPVVAYTNATTDDTDSACASVGAEEDGGGSFFDGVIDHVFFYSLRLSRAALDTMWYTHGACIPWNGLVSRLLLKEGAPGSAVVTAKDSGPAQLDYTANGAPLYAEQTFMQPRRRGL